MWLTIHLQNTINGHTDVCMGAVMTNCSKLAEHLHFMQKAVGAIPSPFDAYLVIRGIKTLHLRMKAHFKNGLAVAKLKIVWFESPSNPILKVVDIQEITKQIKSFSKNILVCCG